MGENLRQQVHAGRGRRPARKAKNLVDALFEQYVDELPTAQTAVNAVPGWTSSLPPELHATAGPLPLYSDDRLTWMLGHYGPLDGHHVLELGPLEGSHTFMLERAGAARIEAVEANRLAFLRCLVAKELMNSTRSRFHLGNFVKWLEQDDLRYDLVVASGVLYHLQDPLGFLELAARATRSLFLWTHYMSDTAMPLGDPRRSVFREGVEVRHFHGLDVKLYPRSYHHAEQSTTFCGGLYDDHRWIDREDLLAVLAVLGFGSVAIGHDQVDHPNGPSFCVFARKD